MQGKTVLQTNQAYVETGHRMNHLVNGQWMESKEEIDILPAGTPPRQWPASGLFSRDIYQGQIRLVTSDRKTCAAGRLD